MLKKPTINYDSLELMSHIKAIVSPPASTTSPLTLGLASTTTLSLTLHSNPILFSPYCIDAIPSAHHGLFFMNKLSLYMSIIQIIDFLPHYFGKWFEDFSTECLTLQRPHLMSPKTLSMFLYPFLVTKVT